MKKTLITFVVSLAFLMLTAVVCWAVGFANLTFWVAFGIGSGILVLGIILLFALGHFAPVTFKIIVTATNAISMGFFLCAWYINRGFNNPLWLMLCVCLLASVYYIVYFLPLLIPAISRHYGWYLLVFFILSIAGYVLLVIFTKTTWVSTLGYFGLLQLGFIISLSFDGKQEKHLNALLVSSYSVFLCAIIILIVALLGAGGGDGCDCSCDGGCDGSGFGKVNSPVNRNKDNLPPPNISQ